MNETINQEAMTRVCLIGYGRMGHQLEALAPRYGCRVVSTIDPMGGAKFDRIDKDALTEVDVCIDFTLPDQAFSNAKQVVAHGCDLVIGTTGWFSHLPELQEIAHDVGVVYGSNFSVGMNAFFLMVEAAAGIMDKLEEYDPWGVETHHNRKADSPSGTALTLGEILLAGISRKTELQTDRCQGVIAPESIHFASVRAGSVPGEHTVGFDSSSDTITLTHTARNREGFAAGALLAAKWIGGNKGIYDFRHIFPMIMKGL